MLRTIVSGVPTRSLRACVRTHARSRREEAQAPEAEGGGQVLNPVVSKALGLRSEFKGSDARVLALLPYVHTLAFLTAQSVPSRGAGEDTDSSRIAGVVR